MNKVMKPLKIITPANRKANKIIDGKPVHLMSPAERRHEARMLRYNRLVVKEKLIA